MSLRHLFQRNGTYQYRRAVPEALRAVIGKREFKRSLKTSDLSIAAQEYAVAHRECEQLFAFARAAARSGGEINAEVARAKLLDLRKALGLQAGQIFDPETQTIAEAVRLLGPLADVANLQQNPGPLVLDAVLGDAHVTVRLSEAPAAYFRLTQHEETGLNPREIDKRHKPVELAFRELQTVIGDQSIFGLQKADGKKFFEHLRAKIVSGDINTETANKKLIHVRKVLRALLEEHEADADNPFAGLNLKGRKGKRGTFDHGELERLFADGVLDGLDPECRAMLWAIADTGASFKELAQLDPARDIVLTGKVPHIYIRSNASGRLKTDYRERTIPLVGLALRALMAYPGGFAKYRRQGGPEAASSNCMKYLKSRGLLPTPQHTVYSLRHSFKDRLRDAELTQEAMDQLMGHRTAGMGGHYGRRYTLDQLHAAMTKIKPIV